jgi:hypothetical protein
VDAARHQREGPRVFRQVRRDEPDGSAALGDCLGRADDADGQDHRLHPRGCLADILLVDGDPLADITVLQDRARILAVMKDGEFHRAPPVKSARTTTRWAA